MSFGQLILLLIGLLILYGVLKNFGTLLMIPALKAYSKGDKAKGVKGVERALKFPMGPQQKLTCAYVLLKEGCPEKAESIISPLRTFTAKKFNPSKARVYYSLIQWKRGELDEAIESLEGLLAEGYRTGILYGNLGYFLLEKGDLDRALEVNLEALDYDPSEAVIRDNLGATYVRRGEWDKALEVYEALLPDLPRFPDAYYNRALIHCHHEEWAQAKDMLIRAAGKNFSYLSTMPRDQVDKLLEEVESKLS